MEYIPGDTVKSILLKNVGYNNGNLNLNTQLLLIINPITSICSSNFLFKCFYYHEIFSSIFIDLTTHLPLAKEIGKSIALMHDANIIHGN